MIERYKGLIKQKLQKVLTRTASILFPLQKEEINNLVKTHTWRERKCVGSLAEKICSWSGYSINLAYLDSRYRGLYGDYVENYPPVNECLELFGQDFTLVIQNLESFVVIFNLDIPLGAIELVKNLGFIPRLMKRNSHICMIYSPQEFLEASEEIISFKVAEMVILQRNIAIHRKPLDSLELPFQHFLYQSNYLHGLVVKEGLWLRDISQPRKSGEFGHDLEIKAISPATQKNILLGVEVFMNSWGYHTESVSNYIEKFNLNGLIIISKDFTQDVIKQLELLSRSPITLISRVRDFSSQLSNFPICHLPLGDVINDLFNLQSQLENILQQSRSEDLSKRKKE